MKYIKQVIITTLLLILTSTNKFNSNEECFPDKGIKIAIITGEIKAKKPSEKKLLNHERLNSIKMDNLYSLEILKTVTRKIKENIRMVSYN